MHKAEFWNITGFYEYFILAHCFCQRCRFKQRSSCCRTSSKGNAIHSLSILLPYLFVSVLSSLHKLQKQKFSPLNIHIHVNICTTHVILLKAAIMSSHSESDLKSITCMPVLTQTHKHLHTHSNTHTVNTKLPLITLNEYTRKEVQVCVSVCVYWSE